MNDTTKRSILRWIHLAFTIPILGYIYGEASEVQPYASAVRFIFVPVIVLSGFWMYSGAVFAVLGVAVWLGAYLLSGSVRDIHPCSNSKVGRPFEAKV